jgi:peroxiredoxin
MWKYPVAFFICVSLFADPPHPTLALGSSAPSFSLPGTDGKMHRLGDYVASKVLVIVFTCDHCPIAQMYEDRIAQLVADYRDKSVAVVAIQPNDPNAIRIDELDSSDLSDSLAEMKIRMTYRGLNYTYLYDGETQSVTEAYGPKATPHAFVFDDHRKLRYEGRFDNSYRKELVTKQDVRNAIDALLAGREVAVAHTGVFGCSTKWKSKEASRLETLRKIEAEPVSLETASVADIKALRENSNHKLLLVSIWNTACDVCMKQFPDLQDTFRMYRLRDFDLVSVAVNAGAESDKVLEILQRQHASSLNLLFDASQSQEMKAAFGHVWQPGVPYTVLITPDGKIAYQNAGQLDMLALRRVILANMPADYIGFQRYWDAH